jgi:hypothetical protein
MDAMTTAEIIADLFRANRELVAENKILREELEKIKNLAQKPEVSSKKEKKPKKPDSEKNPAKVSNGKKVATLNAIRKELLENVMAEW